MTELDCPICDGLGIFDDSTTCESCGGTGDAPDDWVEYEAFSIE